MTAVRTHYIIDMVTGLAVAHYCHMLAERCAFLIDAKLMRIPGFKRLRKYYKPCKFCGWCNPYAGDFITKDEKLKIK